MIESGTLRYHETAHDEPPVVPIAATPTTSGSEPLAAPVAVAAGYWEIGGGVAESTSRKGQITPR